VPIDFNSKIRKIVLLNLTNQICRIKPLRKLRCKPQDSEVFHCGSMGIYANCICPQGSGFTSLLIFCERFMEILCDSQDLSFAQDCLNGCRVAPGIRQSIITNTLIEGLCQKAALDDILVLVWFQLQTPDVASLQSLLVAVGLC
jgi:hypothetical protein